MRRYERAYRDGGCYFFTVNLNTRHHNDLLIRHINAFRRAFRTVQRDHPFTLHAIVILPDHLHALWQLPDDDADFSMRWRLIKARFARAVPANERITRSRIRRGERGIWQRRFWEHLIRDECDWQRHLDYIHYNPVKHGYVTRPADWPYSSIHGLIRAGVHTPDWAASSEVQAMELG